MIRTRLRRDYFLRAAEKVSIAKNGDEYCCCLMLDKLKKEEGGHCAERRAFALLFSPKADTNAANASYQKSDWFCGELTEENQHKRSIALLLMYEFVKDNPFLEESEVWY